MFDHSKCSEKHMHNNVFAKNRGRAAALPCPMGSFVPGQARAGSCLSSSVLATSCENGARFVPEHQSTPIITPTTIMVINEFTSRSS